MEKNFFDVQVGDIIAAYDDYSRDLDLHFLKIESIEEDQDFVTKTNPKGRVLRGTDLEEEGWGDDYITVAYEHTFIRMASEQDFEYLGLIETGQNMEM